MTATTTRTPSWERRAATKRARVAALAAEDPRYLDAPETVRAAGFRAMTAAAETTVDLGQIYARTLAALWPQAIAAALQHIDATLTDEVPADVELAVEQLVEMDSAPVFHLWTPEQASARMGDVPSTARYVVVSYGDLHGMPPAADLVIDLRPRLYDPHTDPTKRELTGHDDRIIRQVEATPGYADIVAAIVDAALALADAGEQQVRIAIGCSGGRHRSVVVAEAVARELVASELDGPPEVVVRHLDIHQPVVERGGAR